MLCVYRSIDIDRECTWATLIENLCTRSHHPGYGQAITSYSILRGVITYSSLYTDAPFNNMV